MAPTAATRSRTDKAAAAKAAPAEDDKDLTDVTDEKGKRLTVQQLKNKLRNEAEREVLDTHKPEVVALTQAKYDQHGLTYVRRLSEEEKAEKVIEELYAKFPNLRPQAEQQQQQLEMVEAVPGGALEEFRNANTNIHPLTETEMEADRNAAKFRVQPEPDKAHGTTYVEVPAEEYADVEPDNYRDVESGEGE